MTVEREHLRALAEEGFDLAAVHFPHVNGSGCVQVLTNFYSVPVPAGGGGSASQGALGVRRDLAPGAVRGQTRTLFQPTTEGTELGALLGRADEEARGFGGFDSAGTVAGPGTLASELRSLLGDAEATPRQTRWNPSHDRGAAAGPSVWISSAVRKRWRKL
jgi:hypothetical protein